MRGLQKSRLRVLYPSSPPNGASYGIQGSCSVHAGALHCARAFPRDGTAASICVLRLVSTNLSESGIRVWGSQKCACA